MNPEQPDLQIQPDHLRLVQRILNELIPQFEVWAFGSRAKKCAKPYSDLDLAIIANPCHWELQHH